MSDLSKVFKAYDIRGKVQTELSPAFMKTVGQAFADFLETEGTIVVGRDMRPDSEKLAQSLIDGLVSAGRNVWDIGQVTSDTIHFVVGKYELAGGAMITASHNPGEYNGLKLSREGALPIGLGTGLEKIRDIVIAGTEFTPADTPGTVEQKDLSSEYLDHITSFVDFSSMKPFKVAIDTANGMAGPILEKLIPRLPFEVVPLYFELDGTFPNHEANPMKVETLVDLGQLVRDQSCDFGIAFDGDGDRVGFVDNNGQPIGGSALLMLITDYALNRQPNATVVHEVRTSRATRDYITELGGQPLMTKAGNVSIKLSMIEHDAPFGGETTGHIMFKENYFSDSALLAALIVVQVMSGMDVKMSEFVAAHSPMATKAEVNFEIEDKAGAIARIKEAFKDEKQLDVDGLSVESADWWFNIRLSNTEPLIRLNGEAATQEKLEELHTKIAALVAG